MIKFEKASQYKHIDLLMPERKTACSAGYDMAAAEDVIIPSYYNQMEKLMTNGNESILYNLTDMAKLTKELNAKPTLVPTGVKCKIPNNMYLELSVRSSSPLKYWLIMANGVGIIDADYYGNIDNDGLIYFQLINLSPFDILIKKDDIIGQGIIKKYYTIENDSANKIRTGGFGSTNETTIS